MGNNKTGTCDTSDQNKKSIEMISRQYLISKNGNKAKAPHHHKKKRQVTTTERREQRIKKSNKNNHTTQKMQREQQHQNNKAPTARCQILFYRYNIKRIRKGDTIYQFSPT